MLLTIDRVREVLKNSPLLNDDDWISLYKASNLDPAEPVDWLPYYKLNSSLLCMACGLTNGALSRAVELIRTVDPAEADKFLSVLKESVSLYVLALYPAGIGPNVHPEAVADNDSRVEREKQKLESELGLKLPTLAE